MKFTLSFGNVSLKKYWTHDPLIIDDLESICFTSWAISQSFNCSSATSAMVKPCLSDQTRENRMELMAGSIYPICQLIELDVIATDDM